MAHPWRGEEPTNSRLELSNWCEVFSAKANDFNVLAIGFCGEHAVVPLLWRTSFYLLESKQFVGGLPA
jgi:hypothetical protein